MYQLLLETIYRSIQPTKNFPCTIFMLSHTELQTLLEKRYSRLMLSHPRTIKIQGGKFVKKRQQVWTAIFKEISVHSDFVPYKPFHPWKLFIFLTQCLFISCFKFCTASGSRTFTLQITAKKQYSFN